MNVSFGSLKVAFPPNINDNQQVFDEIAQKLPISTGVINKGIITNNPQENGNQAYIIYGDDPAQEKHIAKAFELAKFNVEMQPFENPAKMRVKAAIDYLNVNYK